MQLTIKQKLLVLVSLALLALLCVGLFSFFQASKLNDASTRSMERHVLLVESPRELRRLHYLREWSHDEQIKQIFP